MNEGWSCPNCGPLNSNQYRVYHYGKQVINRCIRCSKVRRKTYYVKTAEKLNKESKGKRIELRIEVLSAYSKNLECEICKENHIEFLVIDHISGGGNKHRNETRSLFYNWLKKQSYPDGYRVLCYNCNWKHGVKDQPKVMKILVGELTVQSSYKRKYRNKYPEKYEEYKKLLRQEIIDRKKKVILYYGGKCICCEKDDLSFLSLDHINGGGTSHRKKVGSGDPFYRWVIKNNYPDDLQVKCLNCNISSGLYGRCPHEVIT
jgi:hypothetical protein